METFATTLTSGVVKSAIVGSGQAEEKQVRLVRLKVSPKDEVLRTILVAARTSLAVKVRRVVKRLIRSSLYRTSTVPTVLVTG